MYQFTLLEKKKQTEKPKKNPVHFSSLLLVTLFQNKIMNSEKLPEISFR